MLVDSRTKQSTSDEGRLTPFPTIQINKSEGKTPFPTCTLLGNSYKELASHRVYELFPFFL